MTTVRTFHRNLHDEAVHDKQRGPMVGQTASSPFHVDRDHARPALLQRALALVQMGREVMQTVTFDSTAKPGEPLVLKAVDAGWNVAFASPSRREARGTDFEVSLNARERVPELGVWGESSWGARWANKQSSERLRSILAIISNGSFPRKREQLTKGQSHQLRDAMILEAHAAARRGVFVTADARAFIRNNRREQLEALLETRILSPTEFEAELAKHDLTSRR
jgi:hypothetical protein